MGFNAWRNLGALALAGASLVGCQNAPQKTSNAFTPPPGNGVARTNSVPQPNQRFFNNNNNQPAANAGTQPTGSVLNQAGGFAPAGSSLGTQRSNLGGAPAMQQPNTFANTSLTTPSVAGNSRLGGLPPTGAPQQAPFTNLPTGGNGTFGTAGSVTPAGFTPPPLPQSPAPGNFDVPQMPQGFAPRPQ